MKSNCNSTKRGFDKGISEIKFEEAVGKERNCKTNDGKPFTAIRILNPVGKTKDEGLKNVKKSKTAC